MSVVQEHCIYRNRRRLDVTHGLFPTHALGDATSVHSSGQTLRPLHTLFFSQGNLFAPANTGFAFKLISAVTLQSCGRAYHLEPNRCVLLISWLYSKLLGSLEPPLPHCQWSIRSFVCFLAELEFELRALYLLGSYTQIFCALVIFSDNASCSHVLDCDNSYLPLSHSWD
jgi:hypothetical protein